MAIIRNSFTVADNASTFKDYLCKARLILDAPATHKARFLERAYRKLKAGALTSNAVFALPLIETAFVQPAYFA